VYEVVAPIGEGGMGQVWRATDTTLGRQVAIKILPDAFASDPERLARFEREARTLAALNHPHIAAIYGFEKSTTSHALVMELVEGEDLSQRIARGAIPLDEALLIAKQIAEALEAAHEQGIIHRDLKPANIKVRDDGTVKVLDFGLAKAMDPSPSSPNVSRSPTITSPAMTLAGVIMGTAAYMSPEQARGKAVDKRSDIWAFGCVLFEMLTRTRAFDGEEITDVMMAVMRDEPNWSLLPANTPAAIRRLLRRSLTKDRKRRLSDMTDVRLELEEGATEGPGDGQVAQTPVRARRQERVWAILAIASLLGLAVIGIRALRAPAPEARVVRFEVAPPANGTIETGQPLSPDGRTLALLITSGGKTQIWVRPLDSLSARPLPGTEGASRPFWSPDSRQIAFFVDGNLKKTALTGARPEPVANGPFRDGTWSVNGTILVGGQTGRPLFLVSELGGQPVAETTLDASAGEASHDYPAFLPDGRHYVYLTRRGARSTDLNAYVGTIGSKERRPLPGINAAVRYSASGHLLFLQGLRLVAQPFSADRLELTGEPFPIAEQVSGGYTARFSIADNGTLAYISGENLESQLTWFDRTGKRQPMAPAGVYESVALSPDGRFAAFDGRSPPGIWVLDVDRPVPTRLNSDPTARMSVWSPDGKTIAFSSRRPGAMGLYLQPVGATGADRLLLRGDSQIFPSDWSRDGKLLIYSTNGDLWALPMAGETKPLQLTASPTFQEFDGTLSPDGRWLAYQSDESTGVTRAGQGDIFVQSFPQGSFKRQVSTGFGFAPRWSADGKELIYVTANEVMSVPVKASGSTLEIGLPKPLFPTPQPGATAAQRSRYGLARDGRLLMEEGGSNLSVTVILNWFEQLKGGPQTVR
jgi:eukaryotic-like serine/threonine-protein kinase